VVKYDNGTLANKLTLFGPPHQVAMVRKLESLNVTRQLLVHVLQAASEIAAGENFNNSRGS